jgi:2-amino-4-hydroxy-6-hydroxymethyldihydropteridine diphosphokinase
MNRSVLIIGGNIGNREKVLKYCILELKEIGKILKYSSIYESEPWGFEGVENFYNQVVEIETNLNAFDLLRKTQEIEKKLGRKRKEIQWSDRVIDIDILFFNEDLFETHDLVVPHKEIANRRFVLEPLVEILPNFNHPILNISTTDLLKICTDKGKVWKVD